MREGGYWDARQSEHSRHEAGVNAVWVMGNCPEGCVSACMIQPKEGYRDKLCGRLCTLGRSTGLGSIVSIVKIMS